MTGHTRLAWIVVALTSLGAAQPAPQPDRFARVAFLIGTWEGTAEGQPGSGTSRRTYAQTLDGQFIRVTNRSTYPPQAKNAKGEVHEDEGFLSYDRGRKALVLRQFHVEGFVNQYVEVPGAADAPVVFETEAIENIPAGWRARETWTRVGPDRFEERFELAEPGKSFELYSHSRFTRIAR